MPRLNEEDERLLELTKDKERIIVYNKSDLNNDVDGLAVSAVHHEIDELKAEIRRRYEKGLIAAASDTLNNERQIGLARQAEQSMKDAIASLEAGMELDLVTIDLENSWTALKEITGKAGKEDLLDEIFSRFCLGK